MVLRSPVSASDAENIPPQQQQERQRQQQLHQKQRSAFSGSTPNKMHSGAPLQRSPAVTGSWVSNTPGTPLGHRDMNASSSTFDSPLKAW